MAFLALAAGGSVAPRPLLGFGPRTSEGHRLLASGPGRRGPVFQRRNPRGAFLHGGGPPR